MVQYHYSNYSRGHVLEKTPDGVDPCVSWLLLPAENLWPFWFRGVLYLLAMVYLFVGIAIVSDVFMCAIERITSQKRKIVKWDPEKNVKVEKEVLLWNETVANLTLMALGSSAPEILLAVGETVQHLTEEPTGRDSLGLFTIVGSAAFNLLMITAICIVCVPSPSIKRIKEFGVFMITAAWSIFAYIWMLVVALWVSPGKIEMWEAWVTLAFFPLLVLSAYAQDNGWWCKRAVKVNGVANGDAASQMNVRIVNGNAKHNHSIIHGPSKELQQLESEKSASTTNLKNSLNEEMNGNGNDIVLRDLESAEHDSKTNAANASSILEEKSQFARARFRHAAVRSMLGGRKRGAQGRAQTPRLRALVEKVRAMQQDAKAVVPTEDLKGKFTFARSSYQVYESAGKLDVEVLFHRRAPKQFPASGVLNGNALTYDQPDGDSASDMDFINNVVNVSFETREGTAKQETEFQYTTGILTFKESEWRKTVTIPIVNDNQYENDMDFYVILKNPDGGGGLGDPSVTRCTIIDDDVPGEFSFSTANYSADMTKGLLTAEVIRGKGSDGNVTLQYTTIDGTARGGDAIDDGIDYVNTSGTLCFKHNETSKLIDVEVNKDAKGGPKNFVLCLRNPSTGAKLGEHSAAVAYVNSDELTSRLANLWDDDDEEIETWGEQIKGAMTVGGDRDDDGNEIPPSKIDYILHFITFFWKVVFSFIPPKHVLGGWPAFVISLMGIGVLTLLVEQLAGLLACVMDIEPSVAGITIVALGTSVPDTFASRTAAIQDAHADAAIGNITGSNSVNVFLGLGLPWVISTMYNYFHTPRREFLIGTANLDLGVTVFASVGFTAIVIIVLRRKFVGGELGGKKITKYLTGFFLLMLWCIYIIVSSLRAYKII